MNVEDVLPEQKRLAFKHVVDKSEDITFKATFQLLAGLDHEVVRKELESAHEALWNDMVREGNQDVLFMMVARILREKSSDE